MARLVHATSRVVVNVADEKVVRLGSEWAPADGSKRAAAPTKAARAESPDESWTNKELKAYAEEHAIELGEAKNKVGFLAAIAAVGTESDSEEPAGSDDEE